MKYQRNNIYDPVFAHRGWHLKYPENTLEAYKYAVEHNFAIELDIRFLKDGTIVCFHDRYMKRLLSVPGRMNRRTYDEIKNYKVSGTKYKIPKLEDVLKMVNGRVTILIEIKGLMTDAYQKELERIVSNYEREMEELNYELKTKDSDYRGKVFFHAKNFITYAKAKRVWKERVFFILNPFRKRFEFVKGGDYKKIISVPAIDDIIVEAEDNAKQVIEKLWYAYNRYTTRVKDDHWLLSYNGKKSQIQHRGIVDKCSKEHSKEAFQKCVELNKVIEFDIIKYDGKLVCYHNDKITRKLGQKNSIAEKEDIKKALTLQEILSIVDGKVPIIIDIKDFSIFDRSMEDDIMKLLRNYKGKYAVQSFNPFVIRHFMRKYKYVIRGQVGHSLNGIKKLRRVFLTICNFCLFYEGRPDYIVYDLDPYVWLLSKFNNILGLPVLGYTVVTEEDTIRYSRYFDNFICEGIIEISA